MEILRNVCVVIIRCDFFVKSHDQKLKQKLSSKILYMIKESLVLVGLIQADRLIEEDFLVNTIVLEKKRKCKP